MNELVLGENVSAQYSARTPEGLPAAAEACRLEQEAICGYPLVPVSQRQTHYTVTEKDGSVPQDVYEVFVTYARATPPANHGVDATQV